AAAAALAFARAASDWRSPASWGAWTLGTFPAYGLLVTVFEIVFQDMEPFRAYPSPIPSIVVALAFVVISYAPLRVSPR
ncbi:MAG TPA: hypothetical protein VI997_03420, partial [Candidatus Thermoplasmatota archaeon]|nr:hypothetical protein [Candidatus Thermoplasmatota archaeon]